MLLTITYEGHKTQELGFLLHKNPDRAQQFELNWGKAYVFYPEVTDERTTAALLVDIDPLDLARGRAGSKDGGLFEYVNDRPYATTSFVSTAISRVFATALSGRCDKRPELADTPLDLTVCLYSLKDAGRYELADKLFEPLGYEVSYSKSVLDERFPEWGESPYVNLTIKGKVRLSELLNHLFVLIPVFDTQKHYFMKQDEVSKLISHGEGWLASHPYKEMITRRYFKASKSYAGKALEMLLEESAEDKASEESALEAEAEEEKEARTPLNVQRLNAVKDAVLASGASSVIDLGCGEGRLESLLIKEPGISRITACDVSVGSLEKAASKLHIDRMSESRRRKLTLMQASLTYRDKRFEGFDCACLVEVIEHIDPNRIEAVERSVFEFASASTVIVTTPNREYNVNYQLDELRHNDHRFEWTREEFREWTSHICEKFGYTCVITGIGDPDENTGTPTQMGVFTKNG